VIQDQILGTYLNSIRHAVRKLESDIARGKFASLYDLGTLQGQLQGLEQAEELLTAAIDQADI